MSHDPIVSTFPLLRSMFILTLSQAEIIHHRPDARALCFAPSTLNCFLTCLNNLALAFNGISIQALCFSVLGTTYKWRMQMHLVVAKIFRFFVNVKESHICTRREQCVPSAR